ncbi:MAG: hypothetical protein A2Z25_23280 [Planctomycetes bacterium RBG_16_55_9]|nr:MAG: hypothetical protein A2Z25_23280 [Planctomycetes bacterium RBG_16_55_9]
MNARRRQILGVIGVLIVAGMARADMTPISELHGGQVRHADGGQVQVQPASSKAESRQTDVSGRYDSSGDFATSCVELEFDPLACPTRTDMADVAQPSPTPPVMELTGGPDSCSLCLYALMGVGLCCAPHWVKRLSSGHIHLPEWYHDGGPFQIGHSHAATPDSLCTLQLCLLEPPDGPAEDSQLLYRLGTIHALWRKSQFTPAALASRGPPA